MGRSVHVRLIALELPLGELSVVHRFEELCSVDRIGGVGPVHRIDRELRKCVLHRQFRKPRVDHVFDVDTGHHGFTGTSVTCPIWEFPGAVAQLVRAPDS